MYIAELTVSGIRGFHGSRNVDLSFTRPDGGHSGWTVIAGRNGSGKSTLLKALALALVGPSVARSLVPSFDGWVTDKANRGSISGVLRRDAAWDRFTGSGRTSQGPVKVRLQWRQTADDAPNTRHVQPVLTAYSHSAERGAWSENPQGWFVAGYGPFRRLLGGSSDAQRLMLGADPVARLSTLFHEDASLAEGVTWLIDLYLRSLEKREGAGQLLEFVLLLLNDGLLPDGFRVERVDSDGVWVVRDGNPIPLKEMSDGYRTVTALVLDLVRHVFQAFGTDMIGTAEDGDTPTVVVPGVVLIDEVDVHLHVSWQKAIGGWLKRHFPNIQFIVTSHSPYICQSADPGGLIRLPGVDEDEPPRVVSEELYERVVYGSGDDALLTDLFGIDSPYSERAEGKRRRLARLEAAVLDGRATGDELAEYERLRETLTSSLAARVDEVSARLG